MYDFVNFSSFCKT